MHFDWSSASWPLWHFTLPNWSFRAYEERGKVQSLTPPHESPNGSFFYQFFHSTRKRTFLSCIQPHWTRAQSHGQSLVISLVQKEIAKYSLFNTEWIGCSRLHVSRGTDCSKEVRNGNIKVFECIANCEKNTVHLVYWCDQKVKRFQIVQVINNGFLSSLCSFWELEKRAWRVGKQNENLLL